MLEVLLIVLMTSYSTVLIFLEYFHKKERSELYSRLMAKNFSEYESYTSLSKKNPYKQEHTNFLQKSIREAYREQKGPFDEDEVIKFINKE